jgi:dolichyl-phosphate-mannose--protein O-mannosyl transferase
MGPDMLLLFFIFLAIYFFLLAESADPGVKNLKKYLLFLFLSGFSIGIAISIKWIGLIPMGIIFIYYFRDFLKKETRKKLYPKTKLIVISLLFIPLLVYYFSFCIHFSLLSKENNKAFKFISFRKFYLTNKQMFEAQLGKLTHTYQSKWYSWLLMKRAVSYYHQVIEKKGGTTFIKNITLIGNPILWWLSTLGIFIFFIYYLIRISMGNYFKNRFLIIIPSGYLISLLPFSLIERSLFLYHYFPALIFATIATSYMINISLSKKITKNMILLILFLINFIFLIFLLIRLKTFPFGLLNFSTKLGIFLIILDFLFQVFLITKGGEKRKSSIITILFLLILGTFLLFLPISYGIKTTYNNFYYLMWFRSWI